MTHSQLSFLPDEPPTGLRYVADFLTREHASVIVEKLDQRPWHTGLKRRVQHYGYRYDYKARRASRESYLGPLPEWLSEIAEDLERAGHFASRPEQVIINEYLPGQGIAAHIDCAPCFGAEIASISLLSGCLMRFTSVETDGVFDQYLAPRSLALMQGEARYQWTHGIAARKSDVVSGQKLQRGRRISLTFRTMVF